MLGFHQYSEYECHFWYDGPLIISFMTDQGLTYLAKISSNPYTDEEWEYFAIEATKEEIDRYFEDTKLGKPLNEVGAADVYVIDLGLTIDGWKVIEYNTFNSAGFYDAKISSIIDGINDYLGA